MMTRPHHKSNPCWYGGDFAGRDHSDEDNFAQFFNPVEFYVRHGFEATKLYVFA
jgi:hypothetical protein